MIFLYLLPWREVSGYYYFHSHYVTKVHVEDGEQHLGQYHQPQQKCASTCENLDLLLTLIYSFVESKTFFCAISVFDNITLCNPMYMHTSLQTSQAFLIDNLCKENTNIVNTKLHFEFGLFLVAIPQLRS